MIGLVSTIIQLIAVGWVRLLKIWVSLPTDRAVDRAPGLSRSWTPATEMLVLCPGNIPPHGFMMRFLLSSPLGISSP